MKLAPLYIGLIAAGAFTAALINIPLYRSGSIATSNFAAAVQPLPLSAKHEFIGGRCEACHTPLRGIEAVSCISCHATAAGDLGKQSTAFHASAQQCRDCHPEHKGTGRLIAMDHSALLKIAARSPAGQPQHLSISREMVDDLKGVLGIPPWQGE